MDFISVIFGKPFPLNPHEWTVISVSVPKVNFGIFFFFEPGDPIRFDFPVFNFFYSGGYLVKPFSAEREM